MADATVALMTPDEVKFSALGVNRAHLQDVVQIDYARRVYAELNEAEALRADGAKRIANMMEEHAVERTALREALILARPFFTDGGGVATAIEAALKTPPPKGDGQ